MSAGLVSLEACLLSVSSHAVPSVCVCALIFYSYEDTSYTEPGFIHVTSFYLNHHFKGLISKYGHISEALGARISMYDIERTQISP